MSRRGQKPAKNGRQAGQKTGSKLNGGHFTLSLKNSVGLAAKWVPGESYNYMRELHSSDYQRHMIAEINAVYQPDPVIVDGVEAFVTGGPAQGQLVEANVVLAGTDRVALDANKKSVR